MDNKNKQFTGQNHFWVGSLCCNISNYRQHFPGKVIAASDLIRIDSDLGNRIPDRSWMLYLLEIFNRQRIPLELDLICQFDGKDRFWAIFNGVNRYCFKIRPVTGGTYLRQIIMNKRNGVIEYILMDNDSKESEVFTFPVNLPFDYEGSAQFTGIEWWNRVSDSPFPIRYQVEVMQLMYGQGRSDQIVYYPFNALVPNSDPNKKSYPISFNSPIIKDGCICYMIGNGICSLGVRYSG